MSEFDFFLLFFLSLYTKSLSFVLGYLEMVQFKELVVGDLVT